MSGLDLLKRNASGMDAASFTPTTFGEVAAANTYAFSLQQPLGIPKLGYQVEEAKAFSGRNDTIKKRFGLSNQFDLIDVADIEAKYPNPTTEGRIKMFNEKQDRLDAFIEESRKKEPEKWQDIKTKKEIEAPLRQEARSASSISQEIASRATPTAAIAGTLVGGFGGAMTDVVNLSTLPLGFGSSKGVLKTMLAEGLLNSAIEATQIKGRTEWMNELGMKYGVKEALLDVAFAGGGSAAIVGMVKGGGLAYRSLRQRGSKGVEVLSQASDDAILPSETRDALKYQSRVAHIDEENPAINPTREDVAAHRANLEETQKAVREFREPIYNGVAVKDEPAIQPIPQKFIEDASFIKKELSSVRAVDENNPQSLNKILGYTPKSLSQYIKETGGINDNGLLSGRDIRTPGLITRNKQRVGGAQGVDVLDNQVDVVKQRVFDAGYFPEKADYDEISNDELFEAIEADAKGKKIYNETDREAMAISLSENNLLGKYERVGITPDMSEAEIAQRLFEETSDIPFDPMLTRETNPLDGIRVSVEAMEESAPAFEADFARLLKDNPDMEIDLDGVTVRLSDIADEIKQNNDVLNAIRTCAIG